MLMTKYAFPIATNYPTFTIHSEADLLQLPKDQAYHLIIRGKQLHIPLEEIKGDCIIRQKGCTFPYLKKVWGTLSIDAADTSLPVLETVVGNCNFHEANISVPNLKEVWGKVKVYSNEKYPAIQFAKYGRGSVGFLDLKKRKEATITSVEDVKKIHRKNIYNLTVKEFDGEIPIRIVYGNLVIEDCAPEFPKLECVFGDVIIHSTWGKYRYDGLGNRTKKEKPKNADKPNLFPELERVFGRLQVDKETSAFPKLQQVKELFLQGRCKHIHLDALVDVDKHINITSDSLITLSGLKNVQGNFHIERQYHTNCPALEYIGGNIKSHLPVAPLLKRVDGYLKLYDYSPILSSLNYVGRLSLERKNYFEKIPLVEIVDEVFYEAESKFPKNPSFKVNHAVFRLTNQIHIDEKGFYLSISWWNHIWETEDHKRNRYPFSLIVSLLKLRHSSFQNFQTRQLAREWPAYQSIHWTSLIQKIETLWDNTPKYSVAAIFKLKNRNLRRFCFTFVGVEEIMNILNAERFQTEGIEMNYFRYDDAGNEYPVKKHNIYELYRAKTESIPDLDVRWGWRRRDGYVYAVKCWCTSTEKAHWLWVEQDYIGDPLTAIASTFRIHENVIPHIQCLKRQGDLLICEMKKEVIPKGRIRPLTKEEYFSLLRAES